MEWEVVYSLRETTAGFMEGKAFKLGLEGRYFKGNFGTMEKSAGVLSSALTMRK